MNQVPTASQSVDCSSHVAMLNTFAQKCKHLALTASLQDKGFTVSKGLFGVAHEQAVVVRIQGTLPTTLDQFVHDMRQDEFIRRIDSSVIYSKTLVRYKLQQTADFEDVMLRHIRIQKAIPGMRDMECVLLYATSSQSDVSGRVMEIRVRSHSLAPRDLISLYLRPSDHVIQDPEHYDQIQELFSEIVLKRDTFNGQSCLVDHTGVYQMPGVTPSLYEAVMLRMMLSKYSNVRDYYEERPIAASNLAKTLMEPKAISSSFFAPNLNKQNPPPQLATAEMRAQMQKSIIKSSLAAPTQSLASWFTSTQKL